MKNLKYLVMGAIAASPFADADSFCAYESGLIGTTGVGYLAPYLVTDSTYDWESKQCQVSVFASPDATQSELVDCLSIVAFPSEYHDQDAFVSGLLAEGYPLDFSDYFAFLVFEWKDGFARVKMRSGEARWVDYKRIKRRARYDREGVIGKRGLKSSEHVYLIPDTSAVAPAEDVSGEIPRAFLQALYDFVELPYQTPDNAWDWVIRTESADDYFFDFSYHVTGIVSDDTGALWYVADEHLAIDALVDTDTEKQLSTILGEPIEGSYYSETVRTVFIPYRDADGVVKSVLHPGPYCD